MLVGHLRFRYLDWGNEGLRPLLFLHGGALTAHTWDLCCLALRDEFHCIALDQRGHGDTDWAPDADYSIAAQREDVKGFVDALGLDHFILAGMSMGAINALAFAIHYPERLSAPGADRCRPRGQAPRVEPHPRFRQWRRQAGAARRDHRAGAGLQPAARPAILRRSLMHNLRQQTDGNWVWKYDRRRFQQMGDAHAEERRGLAEGLAKVTCPTLVVRGAESDVFHEEDAERLAHACPMAAT